MHPRRRLWRVARRTSRASGLEIGRFRPHRHEIESAASKLLEHREVRCVLDIGANEGNSLEKLLPQFPKAHVHSFEPTPHIFEKLNARYGSHDRVTLHQLALCGSDGTATFHISDHHVSNSLIREETDSAANATTPISVQTARLAR